MKANLLLKNIGELFVPTDNGFPLKGNELNEAKIIKSAYLAIIDGKISAYGTGDFSHLTDEKTEIIDVENRVVTPGLIDSHTHFVFGGSREHEFALKLNGVSYMEILNSGGGILNTVDSTRRSDFESLYDKSFNILNDMLSYGVTSVEGKSGYGLDFDTEIKQLEVMKKLNQNHSIHIVPTFMAAHAIPKEYKNNREAYIDLIKNKIIPIVAERGLSKYQDVFCEEGVFTAEETRDILVKGMEYGLRPKIHSDEIVSIGGIDVAVDLGAISCEHLMATTDEDMAKMAKNNIIANLLPATTFSLMKNTYARAKDFLKYGNAITICSDYNPGSCPSQNLQMAMFIACYIMKLTPVEILNAVTVNASYSLEINDTKGNFDIGKDADFVIFDAPNIDYIFYNFGVNNVKDVYIKGNLVYTRRK